MPITLAAALAAAAVPQAAEAAVLAPLKPCYVSVDQTRREPVNVDAGGFTPGSLVEVAIDGSSVDTAQAMDDGTVKGSVVSPYEASGERTFTVTLTQTDDRANTVAATTRVTALSLRVKPRTVPPSHRVRFIGSGFTGVGRVWGHYVFGGTLRKTVPLGVPTGPCGHLDAKRRQIPVRRPRTGRWTLQADALKAYEPQPATVFVRLAITVKKVPRSAAGP